jgi:hypothetical protein
MTDKSPIISVSERALIKRINRKLRPTGKALKRARPRAEAFVGKFFILDLKTSFTSARHCDPEAIARELGCLQGGEKLEKASGR